MVCPKCNQEPKNRLEAAFLEDIGMCYSCDKIEQEQQEFMTSVGKAEE